MRRQEEKRGIPPGQIQNFSYAATMNKIKESKNQNEFAGIERARRQTKLQVDQRKIQETLDAQKNEYEMISRLLATQSQEKDTAYTLWRTKKCKSIVISNKKASAGILDQSKESKNKEIDQQMRNMAKEAEVER